VLGVFGGWVSIESICKHWTIGYKNTSISVYVMDDWTL
jgi:hypothetical protein